MRSFTSVGTIAFGWMVSALLVAASGCGSSKETIGPETTSMGPTETAAAGSRLKVKSLAGADGSKVFASLYDSELKTDCAYAVATDGITRCLPSQAMDIVGHFTSEELFFTDAACTIQLARWRETNCEPPAFATGTFGFEAKDVCKAGLHVFPVTSTQPANTDPTWVYYVRKPDGSECKAGGSPSGERFYTVGPELAPTSFVQGTEAIE